MTTLDPPQPGLKLLLHNNYPREYRPHNLVTFFYALLFDYHTLEVICLCEIYI